MTTSSNPYTALLGGGQSAPVNVTAQTTSPNAIPDTTRSITANNSSFEVYTGSGGYGPPTGPGETPSGTGVPAFSSLDDLINRLNGMRPGSAAIKDVQKALADAYYLPKSGLTGHPDDTTRGAYANMLQDVTAYNQQHPDAPLTPDQWLLSTQVAARNLGGAGGRGTAGESTSVSSTVNVSDPITAAVLINRTLSQYAGRGANEQERAQFLAALNSYQSANPATTSTTIDRSTGMVTRSSTHDKAVSPEAFAQAYATSGKLGVEANTYKVATDYYDAAAKVLQAGGGR